MIHHLRILATGQHLTALLALSLLLAPLAPAQDHVVPLAELHGAIAQAHGVQQSNRVQIDNFLSQEKVQTVLNRAGISADRVRQATLLLSNEDQAKLAARIRLAEQDIAGGLTDGQITLIILAVAAFAVMTVIVLAIV